MKNIKPGGLKGREVVERMKNLMGNTKPLNENKMSSKIELTKLAPDNKVYAIVRENHEYYIKHSEKINDLTLEDFQYIGGLANKKALAFESYAKALRKLNLKMISLNEQYEGNKVNVFENDNLFQEETIEEEVVEENDFTEEDLDADTIEEAAGCPCGGNCSGGCSVNEEELKVKAVNDGPKELDGNSTGDYQEVTDEPDKAPNDKSTGTEKEGPTEAAPKKTIKESKKPISILNAMERMDSIFESFKKKSLTETKYKLKVDDPSPEPKKSGDGPSFEDLPDDPMGEPDMGELGMDDLGGEPEAAPADDKPFDDEPFDAGVEASEDEDPKNFIQQLSGKLGQTLRTYADENGVDFDLEKFAINSVISATHTAEMDQEDQKDIIDKIQNSGDDDDDMNEPDMEDDMNATGASEMGDAPTNPASDMGAAPAGGGMGESYERKEVFADPKLGVPDEESNFHPLTKEYHNLEEDDIVVDGGLVDDYMGGEDFERVNREISHNYSRHDDIDIEEDTLVGDESLSNDEKYSKFDDDNKDINTSIDRMINDYLNKQKDFDGDVVESDPTISPEIKPLTKPEPVKIPRRRKPYRVSPNPNPNPKANI
jgi:hypothetical protein